MLQSEIFRKIRSIEIRTRLLVENFLSGPYHSVFKGQGMEFLDVREYSPGDDVRTIDWNVTARMGFPYVKVFQEERELAVVFAVDGSRSGFFGGPASMKRELEVEICALLAFSAIHNNDRIGLVIFTDEVEKFIPPRKGRRHVLRTIREILSFTPTLQGTDLRKSCDFLLKALTRKSIVFIISDFLDTGFEMSLRTLGKKHDVIAIQVRDRRELEVPDMGLVEFEDYETRERLLVDLSSAEVRKRFTEQSIRRFDSLDGMFKRTGIDSITVWTDTPYINDFIKFFKMREARFH
ncbi:MAG: DUF58 domain-containing protein [Candidatus Glassbacteria bacterium]